MVISLIVALPVTVKSFPTVKFLITFRPVLLICTCSTLPILLPAVIPATPVKNLIISSLFPPVSNVINVSPLVSLLDPPLIPANVTPFHASMLFVWLLNLINPA